MPVVMVLYYFPLTRMQVYSLAQAQRCSGVVLEQWDITGTFEIVGASTCGGSCQVCSVRGTFAR